VHPTLLFNSVLRQLAGGALGSDDNTVAATSVDVNAKL
jgi:hypothetical protein